jgi:magnesium-protoporphyrin IX monomethyl ester (oxidative) cyclase
VAQLGASIRAGLAFVSLFTIPSKKHAVPAKTRLEPAY